MGNERSRHRGDPEAVEFANAHFGLVLESDSDSDSDDDSDCPSSAPTSPAAGRRRGCSVPGCTEAHGAHFCRSCGDADSDHFSQHCPGGGAAPRPRRSSGGGGRPRCRAHSCSEAHASHYCKACGDTDADHRSSECSGRGRAAARSRSEPRRHSGCKARGCTQRHAKHYCKYCGSKDSDHVSRKCRRRGIAYTMWHGTSAANAESIKKAGFRPSADGMLGRGVYCSRDRSKAAAFGPVILKLKVYVGKVKKIDQQGHPLQKGWHQAGYDCAWVPDGCGMVAKTENCVWNPKRITVVRPRR